MAEHDVVSGELTANEVEIVTVNVANFGSQNIVGVVNRTQDGVIWVRIDGENPEIEGFDSYPVLSYRMFKCPKGDHEATVRMISDQALDFTVEGGL